MKKRLVIENKVTQNRITSNTLLNTITVFMAIAFLAMISIPLITRQATATLNNAMLNISILRYEPLPAVPGTIMDVWISIENIGDQTAEDVVMEFIDTPVFSVYNDEKVKHIGALQSHQEAMVHYKLLISRNTTLGTNYFKVRYTSNQATGYWFKKELPIDVEIRTPELVVTEQRTIPETTSPANKGVLFLKLSNKGDTLIKDISLQLNINDEYVCSTSVSSYCQLVEKPIALIDASTKKVLQSLKPGETAELRFNFIVNNDANLGVYKIPFTVSFYDEDGNQKSFDDYVTVIINSKPDIIPNLGNIEATDKGFRVTITLSNPTPSTVRFLTVSVDSNMKLSKPLNQYYVGNIDSDDDESIDIDLKPPFKQSKNHEQATNLELNINASFKDEFSNQYEKTFKITIPYEDIPSSKSNNSKTWIVAALIIVIIALIVLKNRKKRNKK